MIIDITCENLKSNEDSLYLPHFQTSGSVAVSSLFIEFETSLSNELITLTSTFVDRNSINPRQQICTFLSQSKYSNYTPTRLVQYKMNRTPTSDAVVKVITEKTRKIKKLYLQLIIDCDGRL